MTKIQKYNFSWIKDAIKNTNSIFRKKENIRRFFDMLPWKLTYWADLDKTVVYTHLGEIVEDDYFKLKEEYIENLIKQYGK